MMAVPTWFPGQTLKSADVNRWMVPQAGFKTSNTSRSSTTTLAPDPDLIVSLSTGWYHIEGYVRYSGVAAVFTTFDFTSPGGTFQYSVLYTNTSNVPALAAHTAGDGGFSGNTNGVGNIFNLEFSGVIHCTSPGNFTLNWAQTNSNATASTVNTLSQMLAWKIG